jgi:hypothetical protein
LFLDLPDNCYYRADTPPRTPVINGRVRQIYKLGDEDDDEALKRSMRDPDAQSALHEQMLTRSLAYWADQMMVGPPEPPFRGQFVIAEHHLEIDQAIQTSKRILVEAARGHGKSRYCSVALPIWRADRHADWCSLIYIFSGSQTLAEERLEELQTDLQRNPKMAHLLPSPQDRKSGQRFTWNQREVNLVNRGRKITIRARGCGVRVRGGHPQQIVCDDLLDDDCLYSETRRAKAAEYFFSVPTNMINPNVGQVIVVGTPFTGTDLYSKIKETGKYICLSFPAINAAGEPLFPQRYDLKALEEKKEEIGPARFSREFLVKPVTDLSSLFPSHLFDGTDIRIPYQLGLPHSYWAKRGCILYSGVDIAMSAEVGADYFVIFTIAVEENGTRWIANITRDKGVGFDRQLQMIEDEYHRLRPDCIYIEANQAQRFIPDEMIRTTNVPIRKFFTSGVQPKKDWNHGYGQITMNKHSLDRGVPALRMGLENRKWRIPRGDEHAIELTDVWIGELQCISFEEGRIISAGQHDDVAMSSWIADSGARLGGTSFDFGPDPAKEQAGKRDTTKPPKPRDIVPHSAEVVKVDELKKEMDEEEFDPFGLGSDFLT